MTGRFENRRVFITGATGFIGGVLARRLISEGAQVTALVRPTSRVSELKEAGANLVVGNVREAAAFDAMQGHDLAIHAAAWVAMGIPPSRRATYKETNVEAVRHFVDAARRHDVPKLVHLSSVAALGAPDAEVIREDTPRPATFTSIYEETKTAAHAVARECGIPVALPMPGIVLGQGGPFDPILVPAARGRLPAQPASRALKPWVHVEDTAEGILLAALKGTGPYLLVEESLSVPELIARIAHIANVRPPRVSVPTWALMAAASVVEKAYTLRGKVPPASRELIRGLVSPMRYDASRARTELGWTPSLWHHLEADVTQYRARSSHAHA